MDINVMYEKVAIIGLGLLGGSLARAMKAQGLAGSITGCGRTPERLKFAIEHGIVDAVTRDPVEAVQGADLVVISTPVGMIPGMIEKIAGHLPPGAIVTDMGSTKQMIVESAERVLPREVHFVGSHPMAGSENVGVEASTATLFQNALCVVTSSSLTEVSALKKVESLWEALKCRVMVMTPQEHDLLVAAASHLPHLAAVSLCRTLSSISDADEKVMPLLAGGFRDTTRIASSSPEIWRDICLANRSHIKDVLEGYIAAICDVRDKISGAGPEELEELFASAKTFRDEVPARGAGALRSDFEIIADVVDRPGVIGEVATALGGASINLKNINIQHVREIGGGTLLIILEKEEDIDRAIQVLHGCGFAARRK